MHDVAVGDDIVLAFQPELAGVTGAGLAPEPDIVRIGDRLGTNKAFLEIGMDHPGRRGRLGATVNGPGAGLLRADSELGDEIEQPVAGANQAIEAGLFEAQRLQKLDALLA